jgi:hypothetical protein
MKGDEIMVAEIRAQAQQHDRLVSWIVVALFIAALLAGWGVKAAAEGRTVAVEAGGLQFRYPAGWVKAGAEPPVLFQAEEWLAPARTAIVVQRRPMPAVQNPLRAVQQTLSLERARLWTAYRTLETDEAAIVARRTAMRVTFAYVETNPNPYLQTVPVVMHGEDYLIPMGSDVYIVTLTAAEANYARAQKALQSVVRSLPQ